MWLILSGGEGRMYNFTAESTYITKCGQLKHTNSERLETNHHLICSLLLITIWKVLLHRKIALLSVAVYQNAQIVKL